MSGSGAVTPNIREMLNKIIEGRVDANRRYIDQILEKIEDQNHRYFLNMLVVELQRMEIEEKAGNLQAALHHKVMAETYKDILEKTFGVST
jgi:DNA polymerase III delta prime subunit